VSSTDVILSDLDGVIWLAHEAIDGAVEAVAMARASGRRVLFVTNNSGSLIREHEAALARIGIPAEGDVVSSAQAAALLVSPGERVLVAGGPGVVEALTARGAVPVLADSSAEGAFDAVVVGWHRWFDFDVLTRAARAVRNGARLIGTNDDATYPTPDGPIPGGGSILAAVQTASGAEPTIAGKPFAPMAQLVRSMVGDDAASRAVMVGDRPSTDGLFARTLGCRYGQVWSGVTRRDERVDPVPDLTADTILGIVQQILG
jgi:HAD superfamily hydrolase (TIGR01450 family)